MEAALHPAPKRERPAEPWRRRLVRKLLYGVNVDRNAKAKARVGLAILAFAAVYGIIAARLVMFAVVPESHFVHRRSAQERISTARPGHPRPQRRKFSRPTCARRRCSPSRAASSISTKRSNC